MLTYDESCAKSCGIVAAGVNHDAKTYRIAPENDRTSSAYCGRQQRPLA